MKKIALSICLAASLFANSELDAEYKENQEDAFKSYNVFMTGVNDAFYVNVLTPISDGYKFVVPETPRNCISNFFDNLFFPVRFVNNLLQGKIYNSFEETERFIVNTTLGFGGIIDIASNDLNIQKHKEDFGQTLGVYGLPAGEHIVLPLFGPSNVRDIFGKIGDVAADPITYVDESLLYSSADTINDSPEKMQTYNNLRKDSVDIYQMMKTTYESYRNKQIKE